MTRFVSLMRLVSPPCPIPAPIGLTISTRSPPRSTRAPCTRSSPASPRGSPRPRRVLPLRRRGATEQPLHVLCRRRTSRSLPFTTIFISKTAAPPHAGAAAWSLGPPCVPPAGITHDQVRGVPPYPGSQETSPTTSGRSIPPRRTSGSVSWRPGRGHHPRQRLPPPSSRPGASTTEAERTRNERGSRPGAGVP